MSLVNSCILMSIAWLLILIILKDMTLVCNLHHYHLGVSNEAIRNSLTIICEGESTQRKQSHVSP